MAQIEGYGNLMSAVMPINYSEGKFFVRFIGCCIERWSSNFENSKIKGNTVEATESDHFATETNS